MEEIYSIKSQTICRNCGYPILVRPSYILSGVAMKVVWAEQQLEQFLREAANISPDYPIVISKFLQDAFEVEVDAVSDGENVVLWFNHRTC